MPETTRMGSGSFLLGKGSDALPVDGADREGDAEIDYRSGGDEWYSDVLVACREGNMDEEEEEDDNR